jgi:mRNA interferase MazF
MFTMTYDRGDILLALFPESNLRVAKPRPVLVVQINGLGSGLNQVVTAMITSNMARAGHSSRVLVDIATPQGQMSGLRMDSVIMTDNLQTIDHSRIHLVLGIWSDMAAVDTALRHTLGL